MSADDFSSIPNRCGVLSCNIWLLTWKQVIPAEEHAAKIASARDAIGDSDFFLIARTDARALSAKSGLSDAIDRANLYMEVTTKFCCVLNTKSFNV